VAERKRLRHTGACECILHPVLRNWLRAASSGCLGAVDSQHVQQARCAVRVLLRKLADLFSETLQYELLSKIIITGHFAADVTLSVSAALHQHFEFPCALVFRKMVDRCSTA
jgi:hypothetical protein